MMTNELLRRYALDRSESAFTELVRQHIDLVYSAALRQVNGDNAAAQDVTQAVFTDLARKAPRLVSHTSLTGWLYTSARFEAAKARRAELRRHLREQESHAMNQLLQTSETEILWQEMRPALDDVMHQLNDADREALLLRYFERKPLAEVGARLGLSENAARMRIERALEKTRALLSKRGITSTAAALAIALTERAVAAAPAALVSQVSRAALSAVATSGVVAGLFPAALKWMAGAAIVVTVGFMVWTRHISAPASAPSSLAASGQTISTNTAQQNPVATVAQTTVLDTTNKLSLHIVTADSGQPIPMVELRVWVYTNDGDFYRTITLQGDRFGNCEIPFSRSSTVKLMVFSGRDGFANTRLQWNTARGESIPQDYTMHLARAALIGGDVVDADGNPVAGAQISFYTMTGEADSELRTESSNFISGFWIDTTSDSSGHWQLDRIVKEAVPTLEGTVQHPEHAPTDVSMSRSPENGQQLLAGSFVFHLGRAAEVMGRVTDLSGRPISDARVLVGWWGFAGTRETRTSRNGNFSLAGCKTEKTVLTVMADGFPPVTSFLDLTTKPQPIHVSMRPGKDLRLRVVDTNGDAISNASVYYNPSHQKNVGTDKPPSVDTSFGGATDKDGRVTFKNAPNVELHLNISASGFGLSGLRITPDGEEHTFTFSNGLTLPQPLTLFGSVTDASTGLPVPVFRLITGVPVSNDLTGVVGGRWGSELPGEDHWLKFVGGSFRHTFADPPLRDYANKGFIFKIEADDYATFVSHAFRGNEGEVRLDAVLQPAHAYHVTVLLPNGQPAVAADVGLVSQASMLELLPGHFFRDAASIASLLVTDARGCFTLAVDLSVTEIIVAHPQGFAQTTPASLAENQTIQLQPWGGVEGYLTCDRLPSNSSVLLEFGDEDFRSISAGFEAAIDANGHFSIPQAPPGRRGLSLFYSFVNKKGEKCWIPQSFTNVDIPPGETVRVAASTTIPPH
jgi:RNA polymerase sigma factor (sigma-70 family)